MATDTKAYKILIIEDNLGDFALVEDFLFEQMASPGITHVKDFKSSKAFLASGEKFDVVLLDLSLPDKTGELLIMEIVELCLSTPIIVLTGYTDFTFGVRSLSLGISDYLLKDELTSMSLYKSIIYSRERSKANFALIDSEKKYSELFHLSPLPMWVVDLDTLQFLDVNKATVHHYGYTREELLAMTLKDIRPVEEIPALERRIAEDKLHPDEQVSRTVVHQKKNGGLINVEIQIAPVLYKEKRANMVIATDITERLNYIHAIERQNEKLKEISWMQSHIIRAPLSRIMGLILLLKDAKNNDEQKMLLGYLTLSADELDGVIRNITDKTSEADYPLPGSKFK